MRYVNPPDVGALPSLLDIERSLESPLKALLKSDHARIQQAYEAFDAATPQKLHRLKALGLSKETKTALAGVFKSRKGACRRLVDGLTDHFESTGNATCPYCNFGEQWEHDHYLPKDVFPEFTLYPKNLVPICKVCNGKKLTQYAAGDDRLFIHLFSELQGVTGLLRLKVEYEPTVNVSFSLANPGLPSAQFEVLERHFSKLGLGNRYARQASAALGRLIRSLRTQQNLDLGRARLRTRLRRMADDRALQSQPNHWEVVLLEELAGSVDFTEHIFA